MASKIKKSKEKTGVPKLAKSAAAESFFAPASALVSSAPGAIYRAIKAGATAESIVAEACDSIEAGIPLDAVALPQDVHLEDGGPEVVAAASGAGAAAAVEGSSSLAPAGSDAPAAALARATTAAAESSDMVAPETRSAGGVRAIALAATAELLRRATRDHALYSRVQSDLEASRFPAAYAASIAEACKSRRKALEAAFAGAGGAASTLDRLARFRWRLDVDIASSATSRVMKPRVIAEVATAEGALHTFTMSVEQFHALRYGAAKSLQGLQEAAGSTALKMTSDRHKNRRQAQDRDAKAAGKAKAAASGAGGK